MLWLFKEKIIIGIFALIFIFTVLYFYNDRVATSYLRSQDTQMRMAVIRNLGVPAVPIISQCCTSRNLPEGLYARRSDTPGGFCFHSDCDVAAVPGAIAENKYTIKVVKNRNYAGEY